MSIFNDFLDYPFEDVMFRWAHQTHEVYRKFYGEIEESGPVPPDNRLYRDALRFGDEVSAEQYRAGKPR